MLPPAATARPETGRPDLPGYAASLSGPGADPDEAVRDGRLHPAYRGVADALGGLTAQQLHGARAERDRLSRARGMTFPLPGARPGSVEAERLFPLDLVPRLVDAEEWALVRRGLEQRARALQALLADLAGPRECVRAGVLPAALAPPPVAGTGTADRVHAVVAGMDLLRAGTGRWLVLEDNLRVPSGLGYAVLVREVAAGALPMLRPPAGTPDPAAALAPLLGALHACAPPGATGAARIAVLSAGPTDSAWAEHRLLAERLDVPLLTTSDLRVLPGPPPAVAGPAGRIDVLYRRLDEPELAAAGLGDGTPALPALADAVRAGTLGLANALGTGAADDKAVCARVPALMRFFLGEEPLLDGVRTWLLADPEQRGEALERLDELVVKPCDGYGGRGVVFGETLTAGELGDLRARLQAEPRAWVAQEPVLATTHPTLVGDALSPCRVDLRAFVLSGVRPDGTADPGSAVTLPAALTRVAPPGSKVVNSSRGGGAKDTWLPA